MNRKIFVGPYSEELMKLYGKDNLETAVLYKFNNGKIKEYEGYIRSESKLKKESMLFIKKNTNVNNLRYQVALEPGVQRNNLIWFFGEPTIGKLSQAAFIFKEHREETKKELLEKIKQIQIELRTLDVTIAKLNKKIKEEEDL